MICPNCDSILNVVGCHSCGWKHADSWPTHRLVTGSVHPLKPGAEYPKRPISSGAPLILRDFGKNAMTTESLQRDMDHDSASIVEGLRSMAELAKPETEAPESAPVAYAVGTLTDENGEPAGHVLVGPIPQAGKVEAEKAIPDPANKTIQ